MKNTFALPAPLIKKVILLFVSISGLLFIQHSFAQFTTTWALTSDQSFATTGAAAADVTGANQVMSGTLFIPAANSYAGVASSAPEGQRCSPKQNDGNDGGWLIDGSAVEGRYMEFVVNPNTGFDMNVTTIAFSIGNRSTSNLRGSAYYYVGATNAAFTLATGTALGTALRAGTSTNQYNSYSYSTSINVTSGNKIFVRIYPYNTASLNTGKYFCTKAVSISGTTTSPNVTDITFTTPGTCINNQITVSWTGPSGFNAATTTLLAFLKPTSAVTIGTPSSTLATYTASTFFGTGTNYQNDAAAKCIYKATGTDAFGNHSGLTITGLAANTTYHLLIFIVTNATNTYTASAVGNGTTLAAAVAEPTNHPTVFAKGTVTTSSIVPTWTAAVAGAQAPLGYLLQASNSATPADPGSVSPLDGTDLVDQTNISGGTANAKVTPNTATTYAGITGFSAGTMYYYRINSYTNTGSCINYKPTGLTMNAATLPNAVTSPLMIISGTTGTISWTTAAGYNNSNHTTLVFVKAASAVNAGTPTSNPSTYTASTNFASPLSTYQLDASATCVYKGDGTTVNVTGLTAGASYFILILTVVDASNSDATNSYSAYATATSGLTYTWIGGNSSWIIAANWSPARTTPATTDVLIFNTPGTVVITSNTIPNQTIASLTVTNGCALTIPAISKTLTITSNNGSNSDLIVSSGASLTLGTIMNVVLSANTIADISGTFLIGNGCTYNSTAAGAVTTLSGTINRVGTFTTTGTASNFVITSTGVYIHAINGGTIPPGTWNTGSTCRVTGVTTATNNAMSGHRQLFSKFVWDCPNQSSFFVLGASEPNASVPPIMEVTDSFIVYRTNGQILQITSSGGQRDFTVGNYIQYGGIVAVTYNTNASGGQRSLSVNNSFYVTDSMPTELTTKFQIVNTANSDLTNGRLYVGGNAVMRLKNGTSVTLEKNGTASSAEMWFTGTSNQYATFSTVSDSVDFVTAQNLAGFNVTLGSNLKARKFMLTQGTFNIASNTLTIDREVSYPSPGTGTFGGSASSNLTMTMNGGNAGTLNFASGKRTLKDFTQTLNNTVTLGTELAITAGANPGRDSLGIGATLNTNDNLVLRSDGSSTARMAQLPVNGSGVAQATINGKVTVERYLPMNLSSDSRRWRLLTAPFKSTNAPTINAAWQEGSSNPDRLNPGAYDPKPGYGTHITRSIYWWGDGYDQGSTMNPSIFYYNAGSWQAPANTNTVKITDNSGCYMLFARGDRSIVVSTTTINASPTTLDPKGELNTGRVTIPLVGSGYQTVGNPYASAIKLDNISFNDTLGNKKTIYLWDPKTLGSFNVGKFITCSGDGGSPATYTYTGNTSAYSGGVIESSGAFMVKGNGGNIVFNESDKIIASSSIGMASRPVVIPNSLGRISKLYTDLVVIKNGIPVLADGVANTYNKYYSSSIDNFDAGKLTTFTSKEELSIKRGSGLFAIERRKSVFHSDTIFLNLSKPSQAEYQFNFRPVDFDNRYEAFLEDQFLRTITPVSLSQQTTYSFSITSNPASIVSDRFRIIFKKTSGPKNISLRASLQQNDAALEWDNSDEDDVDPNWVERSTDGANFNSIAAKTPGIDTNGEPFDKWLDKDLLPGNYYYRIRFTNDDEQPAYSNVVKISKTNKSGMPSVMPNPVTNGQINLYMGQLPPGTYGVRISNSIGQLIYTGSINHQNGNSVEKIILNDKREKGLYHLEIMTGNKTIAALSVLMQ